MAQTIAKKRWKISAQQWQQTDQHILELGNEPKWQVFLDRFRKYGVGPAIFAGAICLEVWMPQC